HLAYEAWQAGDLVRMSELLDRDKTFAPGNDPRGFEWDHLKALLASAPLVMARKQAHGKDAYYVTWSPDGRTLASCGLDGFVRLWEPQTLSLRAAWQAHGDEVNMVLFAPNGKSLATASDDGSVRLWMFPERKLLRTLSGHGGGSKEEKWVESMAFSPDGT